MGERSEGRELNIPKALNKAFLGVFKARDKAKGERAKKYKKEPDSLGEL